MAQDPFIPSTFSDRTLAAWLDLACAVGRLIDREVELDALSRPGAAVNYFSVDSGEERPLREVLFDITPEYSVRIVQWPAQRNRRFTVHVREHEYDAISGSWGSYSEISVHGIAATSNIMGPLYTALWEQTPLSMRASAMLCAVLVDFWSEICMADRDLRCQRQLAAGDSLDLDPASEAQLGGER